jgi:hypothetical protein
MGSGDAKTPAWLALLFVIAIVSFVVLGDVIARRDASATAWAGLTMGEPLDAKAQPDPLTMLARGVAESATSAARSLSDGNATAAAVASDAAMRAAGVGRDGAPQPSRAAFDSALRLVRQARAQRQNGDPAAAATTMRRVPSVMSHVPGGRAVLPTDVGSYDGARLLNAAGVMIGVVDHVSGAGAGLPSTATVVLGGYHHVLGFLDFGGTRLTVPLERLVFGKARRLGATRVVLATTAQTAADAGRAQSPVQLLG